MAAFPAVQVLTYSALRRRDAQVEDVRDLLVRQADDVAEDERRPVLEREGANACAEERAQVRPSVTTAGVVEHLFAGFLQSRTDSWKCPCSLSPLLPKVGVFAPRHGGNLAAMTQYEQENDLGRGGGEVDEETMDEAWRTAAERRSTANVEGAGDEDEEHGRQPWAKASSGEIDDE